ncbi:mCG148440 [Mus musculus]|nr:mCG148440 [Mus musculus]
MRPSVLIRGWEPPLQLMSAVTQESRSAPRHTRGVASEHARDSGRGARNAEDWRGLSAPAGRRRGRRLARRGNRSGAVARRAARAQRSWVAPGCWCWSRRCESPPRWHPAPRPHLVGFFPGRGAAASPPPPSPPRVTDAWGRPPQPAAPPCATEA